MNRATENEIEAMRRLAREAGKLVLSIRDDGFDVEMKGVDDPVTRADREANQLICGELGRTFASHGVLGEESVPGDPQALAAIVKRSRVFFVDPVDGTREFADKRPDFCVMIGLAVGGRAVAGAVFIPMEDKLFWTDGEGGAFVEEGKSPPRELRIEPPASTSDARAVVSRSHASPDTSAVLGTLGITAITPCGSVGVKIARVIEGKADLYVHVSGGAKLWDSCAPEAILRAAGGDLGDLDGRPIDYHGPLGLGNGLIAAHPSLVGPVKHAVASLPSRAK
ncbi:MAG: 3'(2'),5'-bisphosphate nucleotidase CysQ [Myxococcales bacterium]|nr:3'(2'),5'-bisphosphate nucleotidase CysQ [Myxococcales bacterium]